MGTDICYYIQVNKHAQQFHLNAKRFTLLWSYLNWNENWEDIADQFEEDAQALHDFIHLADREEIDLQFVGMEKDTFIIELELLRYSNRPIVPKRWVNVKLGREIFWRAYSQFAVIADVRNDSKDSRDKWPVLFECRDLPMDMGTSFTSAMKEEYAESHDASFLSLAELEQIHQQEIMKERGSPIETAVVALNGYAESDGREKEDIRVVFWFGS